MYHPVIAPFGFMIRGLKGKVPWKWPRARARRIEDGNHALIGANVAVDHIGCVIEESRNGPTRVGGVGPRPLAGGPCPHPARRRW